MISNARRKTGREKVMRLAAALLFAVGLLLPLLVIGSAGDSVPRLPVQQAMSAPALVATAASDRLGPTFAGKEQARLSFSKRQAAPVGAGGTGPVGADPLHALPDLAVAASAGASPLLAPASVHIVASRPAGPHGVRAPPSLSIVL